MSTRSTQKCHLRQGVHYAIHIFNYMTLNWKKPLYFRSCNCNKRLMNKLMTIKPFNFTPISEGLNFYRHFNRIFYFTNRLFSMYTLAIV